LKPSDAPNVVYPAEHVGVQVPPVVVDVAHEL
jgi:hypothetical protein